MQRLFTMFPRGLPGLALVFLRLSAATALMLNCLLNRSEISGWIQLGAVSIVALLCIGFLTPIAALVTLALHALIWAGLDSFNMAAMIVVTLDALALALLGPGAYSMDAYRFGRRVLVLPPPDYPNV